MPKLRNLRHRHVEPVREGRAALVEMAHAFDRQAGLAGDDVQFAQRRQSEGAVADLDDAAALALEAVERGADVDVEAARVADAGGVVVEAARVVGAGREGAAQDHGARADRVVLIARVVGAGGRAEQQKQRERDGLPQLHRGGGGILRAQHRADANHTRRARVDAPARVRRVDAAEGKHRPRGGAAGGGQLLETLRALPPCRTPARTRRSPPESAPLPSARGCSLPRSAAPARARRRPSARAREGERRRRPLPARRRRGRSPAAVKQYLVHTARSARALSSSSRAGSACRSCTAAAPRGSAASAASTAGRGLPSGGVIK